MIISRVPNASIINEIHISSPEMGKKDLFKTGTNVVRDMMGTMANTLILAFTGTSVNSLILFYSYDVEYNQLINMNMIAIEIIQGMSGSIAIILTVPIISFISACMIPIFHIKNQSHN